MYPRIMPCRIGVICKECADQTTPVRDSTLPSSMTERHILHNRYLPTWLHRICNAGFGSLLIATLGTLAVTNLLPNAAQAIGLFAVIVGTVVTGFVLLVVNPNRFSTVEGVAGEDGYDELIDDPCCDSLERPGTD